MTSKLEKFYNAAFNLAMRALKGFDPSEIAGAYIAIGMRLYKTTLSDEDYKKMIKVIVNTTVKPYKPTLH
tara:strand:- start:34 stop:243 length:210 start_codon:yes stop_codon:yes gene_type:complete